MKKQLAKSSNQVQEQEQLNKAGDITSNPKNNRIRSVKDLEKVNNSRLIHKEARVPNVDNISLKKGEEEARRIKKEDVLEVVNKEEANKGNNLNPTTTGIISSGNNGVQEVAKASYPNPNEAGIE